MMRISNAKYFVIDNIIEADTLTNFYRYITYLYEHGLDRGYVIINSDGGDFTSSLTISYLIYSSTDINFTTINVGSAASGAFMILLAGQYRVSVPWGDFMSHIVQEGEDDESNKPLTIKEEIDLYTYKRQLDYFIKVTTLPYQDVVKYFLNKEDKYFSSVEMHNMGLVHNLTSVVFSHGSERFE